MMHPPEVVLRTQLAAKLGAAVAIALPFSNIGFQIALQSVNRVSNNFFAERKAICANALWRAKKKSDGQFFASQSPLAYSLLYISCMTADQSDQQTQHVKLIRN